MEFALCLRMRQKNIKSITRRGKEVEFEIFKDECSTYVYIPTIMEGAGTLEFAVKHS
jgi:hypothetical protein